MSRTKGGKNFVYILACFAMIHRNELSKTGRLRMTLAQLLVNVAQPMSCGWLFNNQYLQRHLDHHQAALVATGTTRNEALHAGLNLAFRQTIRPDVDTTFLSF